MYLIALPFIFVSDLTNRYIHKDNTVTLILSHGDVSTVSKTKEKTCNSSKKANLLKDNVIEIKFAA